VKVDFDIALLVVASGLYRLLAHRMRGYADAQARHIFRDLIDAPADVSTGRRFDSGGWLFNFSKLDRSLPRYPAGVAGGVANFDIAGPSFDFSSLRQSSICISGATLRTIAGGEQVELAFIHRSPHARYGGRLFGESLGAPELAAEGHLEPKRRLTLRPASSGSSETIGSAPNAAPGRRQPKLLDQVRETRSSFWLPMNRPSLPPRKNDQVDLTAAQLKTLSKVVREEFK
jgi:hypothetical protein